MLSKSYAEKKKEETGSTAANLDLTGSMLNALEYKIKDNGIEIGVYGKEDAGKADGHNNFSGLSKLPRRQFLPDKGQSFDDPIKELIKDHIEAYKADNMELDDSKLKQIETTNELYDYLRTEFEGLTKSEIKQLVLQSEIATQLDDFDILDLL